MENMIAKMEAYIASFIEKPHPAFNGLPPCPFARRARVKGLIQFESLQFENKEDILELAKTFQDDKEVMVVMHPGEISLEKTLALVRELNEILPNQGLQAFHGHPLDEFNVAGLYTRRDPFPNIQVARQELVEKFRATLPEKYYQNWTDEHKQVTEVKHPSPPVPGPSTP